MMNNWQSFCTSVLKIVMGLCKNVSETVLLTLLNCFYSFPGVGLLVLYNIFKDEHNYIRPFVVIGQNVKSVKALS